MSSKNEIYWKPETRLDTLGLPFVDVVLTERFLLPPVELQKMGEQVPKTISDVSRLSGMPHEEICSVINECLDLGKDIWLNVTDLTVAASSEGTIVIDMRPDVTFDSEPLHDAARIFHLQNPAILLPLLKSCTQVLVLSHSESHAWSAAISLRKMEIKAFLPR